MRGLAAAEEPCGGPPIAASPGGAVGGFEAGSPWLPASLGTCTGGRPKLDPPPPASPLGPPLPLLERSILSARAAALLLAGNRDVCGALGTLLAPAEVPVGLLGRGATPEPPPPPRGLRPARREPRSPCVLRDFSSREGDLDAPPAATLRPWSSGELLFLPVGVEKRLRLGERPVAFGPVIGLDRDLDAIMPPLGMGCFPKPGGGPPPLSASAADRLPGTPLA
mmetsp:Transcript_8182/g.15986  ORF Transcript_8182/g.15986 Transcript_8182/m.15986 type:complete len:223 (+) Transcript_8182:1323-1991(+)